MLTLNRMKSSVFSVLSSVIIQAGLILVQPGNSTITIEEKQVSYLRGVEEHLVMHLYLPQHPSHLCVGQSHECHVMYSEQRHQHKCRLQKLPAGMTARIFLGVSLQCILLECSYTVCLVQKVPSQGTATDLYCCRGSTFPVFVPHSFETSTLTMLRNKKKFTYQWQGKAE